MAAGRVTAAEGVAPATPAAGYRTVYPLTDGWYEKDDAGVEAKILDANDKNAANGVAGLDGSSQLADAQVKASNVTQHSDAALDSSVSGSNAGALIRTGASTYSLLMHNLASATNPTANEDSGDGYAVGSLWINTTDDLVWMCVDATLTAAVWRKLSLLSTASGDYNPQHGKITEATTTRTLSDSDHGQTIYCTNAAGCTVTVNTGLRADFFCTIVQRGTAQVTISAGTATLIRAATFASPIKTKELNAACEVRHAETANTHLVTGVLEAA